MHAELEHLEEEVLKEMDGVESSFTTQKKVYKFLINDLENHNESITNELISYRQEIQTRIDSLCAEVACLREVVDGVTRENVHIHEMLLFYANQYNRRATFNKDTLTSISSDDSSVFLEEIIDDLQESTTRNESISSNKQANQTLESCQISVYADDHLGEKEDEEVDEIIETLTENIILKDRLLQHQENEIPPEAKYVILP